MNERAYRPIFGVRPPWSLAVPSLVPQAARPATSGGLGNALRLFSMLVLWMCLGCVWSLCPLKTGKGEGQHNHQLRRSAGTTVGRTAILHSRRLVVGTHGYRAHEGGLRTIRSVEALSRGTWLGPRADSKTSCRFSPIDWLHLSTAGLISPNRIR